MPQGMGYIIIAGLLALGTYYGVKDGVIPAVKETGKGVVWVAKQPVKGTEKLIGWTAEGWRCLTNDCKDRADPPGPAPQPEPKPQIQEQTNDKVKP